MNSTPIQSGTIHEGLSSDHQTRSQVSVMELGDSFSLFDWGKMPDLLSRTGEAKAIFAADFFEKVEAPEVWREFSRSSEALALRKASRFGGAFNEMGEELQNLGIRTQYLGVFDGPQAGSHGALKRLNQIQRPHRALAMIPVHEVKPTFAPVLGRTLPDYYAIRTAPLPRLIPFHVRFRFASQPGGSFFERATQDSTYLAQLGFAQCSVSTSQKWDFPILELLSSFETSERSIFHSEALAISGLTAAQLQDLLLKSAWLAGLLRHLCARSGLDLWDGRLDWALAPDGKCFLAGPQVLDGLKIFKGQVELTREFLKPIYQKTRWYQSIEVAKQHALVKGQGSGEWRRWAHEATPHLPPQVREIVAQSYFVLTNLITARNWFSDVLTVDHLVGKIQEMTAWAESSGVK